MIAASYHFSRLFRIGGLDRARLEKQAPINILYLTPKCDGGERIFLHPSDIPPLIGQKLCYTVRLEEVSGKTSWSRSSISGAMSEGCPPAIDERLEIDRGYG